jgi:hypothetical protein
MWKATPAILLVLAACVGQQVSPAEQQAAAKALFDCWRTNAVALDDGRSDAATIGQAAAGACNSRVVAMARAQLPGRPDLQLAFMNQTRQENADRATQIVLTERRRRGAR